MANPAQLFLMEAVHLVLCFQQNYMNIRKYTS